VWPFSKELPLASGGNNNTKPDIVLSLRVSKHNAKARYSARARDSNDSNEKFERRFAEYEEETIPVEESYRQRGILVDVSS
jgi:adenylate kinase family enzyme